MVKSSPGVSPKPRFGPNLDLTAKQHAPRDAVLVRVCYSDSSS